MDDMYNKYLKQIANTILINTQMVIDSSFPLGKFGIIIFLYNYSRYTNNTLYSDYANNILDDIYDKISKNTTNDFQSGLAGIGWVIEYLIKNKFVEGDNETLEEIDEAIESMTIDDYASEMQLSIPLFSKGLYFLQRNKKNKIEKAMIDCNLFLSSREREIPLSYLNSILYIINIIKESNADSELCISILDKLFYLVQSNIDNKLNISDIQLYTLRRNIQHIIPENEKIRWLKLVDKYQVTPKLANLGWIYLIYQYDSFDEIKINEIELQNTIDSIARDLEAEDLSIYVGLAGLGLELIRLS